MAIATKIDTRITAEEVTKDLLANLNKIFGEETYKTLELKIKALQKEAIQLQREFQNVQNIINQQQYSFNNYNINNNQIYAVALKIYVFIEKLREFFTKETYEYLLYISGKRQSTVQVKQATLEEILPFIGVIENSSKELKLNLSMRRSDLRKIGKDVKVSNEKLINILNNFYLELQNNIFYTTNKKTKRIRRVGKKRLQGKTIEELRQENIIKVQMGYAYEAATLAAIQLGEDPTLTGTRLLNRLVKIYGEVRKGDSSKAFYRGGDISLSAENANLLLKEAKPIELQLKNLSNGFASIAEFKTLSTILNAIVNLLSNKNLSAQSIANALNVYIFKAEKNINNTIANSLSEVMENTLSQTLESFKRNTPNIKIY